MLLENKFWAQVVTRSNKVSFIDVLPLIEPYHGIISPRRRWEIGSKFSIKQICFCKRVLKTNIVVFVYNFTHMTGKVHHRFNLSQLNGCWKYIDLMTWLLFHQTFFYSDFLGGYSVKWQVSHKRICGN